MTATLDRQTWVDLLTFATLFGAMPQCSEEGRVRSTEVASHVIDVLFDHVLTEEISLMGDVLNRAYDLLVPGAAGV
jgi:hypothetical protein